MSNHTPAGTPFEVAVVQRRLDDYLDLCAEIGFARIECAEGFTDIDLVPGEIVRMAQEPGLEVQFELGKRTLTMSLT
jgi:phosphosulfolactate synthase